MRAEPVPASPATPMSILDIARQLSHEVAPLTFAPPVAFVYNPLDYARAPFEAWVDRFGPAQARGGILLVGMNPGPFGMAQTGVPFGEVAAVRDWMGIDAPVGRPDPEHPKRPVQGFACPRSEVSGRRVWGWAAERFGTPEHFFARFFVWNWCPLLFLGDTGRNLTPDHLPAAGRDALYDSCDRALGEVIGWMRPEWVVGVGGFAEARARAVLDAGSGAGEAGRASPRVGRILHPSPASPAANRGWAEAVDREWAAMGIPVG